MLARRAQGGDPRAVRRSCLVFLIPGAMVSGGGCLFQPVGDSCVVNTDEISMEAFVVDNGTSVRAVADFQDGPHGKLGSQRLELCADDELTINGMEASEVVKSDRVEYAVSWDLADAPSAFEFVLTRAEHTDVSFDIELPPTFAIIGPQPDAELSRAQDLTVDWAPPEAMEMIELIVDDELGEPCGIDPAAPDYAAGIEVPDVGSLIVPAGTIIYDGPPSPTGACAAHMELTRRNEGTYPEVLEPSGRVEGRVERRLDFVSVP